MQLSSLIGKKQYQKHGFLQSGKRIPLTAVMVGGNVITQIKTSEKEGYNSLQLGINNGVKARKSIRNHSAKALKSTTNASAETSETKKTQKIPTFFREVRLENAEDVVLGSKINANEVFAPGDIVDVTGISKGKGWAGGVKRYGFKGGPKTHGQSDRHRAPGSIGQGTTPGRVYRGKRMAGRMGSDTVTVKNLEVIEVADDGVLLIKGLVPGNVNGMLMVKKVGENKNFEPLYKEMVKEPEVVEEEVKASEEVAADETKESVEAKEVELEKSTSGDTDKSEEAKVSDKNEEKKDVEVKEEKSVDSKEKSDDKTSKEEVKENGGN